jgi:CheY-like chemotaxis protein
MPSLEGKRILVVEDEPLVAMLLEEMLLDLGCEVVGPAYSIAQAARLAQEEVLDAAVLDVNVNGEMSHSVAAILHARAIPFAFATGYGSAAGAADSATAPVLHKPYPASKLTAVLERLIG